MSQVSVTTTPYEAPRLIPPALIVVMGASFALAVLVISFFLNVGLASFTGGRRSKLAEWVDDSAIVYGRWRASAPAGLPSWLHTAMAERRGDLVAGIAKAVRAPATAAEEALKHVSGVELCWAPEPNDKSVPPRQMAVACVHFDTAEFLKKWVEQTLQLEDPILCQGRPTYRLSSTRYLAPVGDTLLVASELSHVETILPNVDARLDNPLAADHRFRTADRAHGSEGLGWLYAQPPGLLARTPTARSRNTWRTAPGLALALVSARTVAAHLELPGGGAVLSATLFGDRKKPGSRTGASWLGLRNSNERALLRFVPTDVSWAFILSLDKATVFWSSLHKWLKQAGPRRGLRSEIDLALERLEREYAVDIQTEVASCVGAEAAVFGVPLSKDASQEALVFAAELRTSKEALITLARMEGSPALRSTKYENRTFLDETVRVAELDEGLSYAVMKGCVLVSPRVEAIQATLLAAKEGGNLAMKPTPAFVASRRAVPSECALLGLANVERLDVLGPLVSASANGELGLAVVAGVAAEERLQLTAAVPWQTSEAGSKSGKP